MTACDFPVATGAPLATNDNNTSPLGTASTATASLVSEIRKAVPEPDLRSALHTIDNRVKELGGAVGAGMFSDLSGASGKGDRRRRRSGDAERFQDRDGAVATPAAKARATAPPSSDGVSTLAASSSPAIPPTESDRPPDPPSESDRPLDEEILARLRSLQSDASESLKSHFLRHMRPVSVDEYRSLLDVYGAYDEQDDDSDDGMLEDGIEGMSIGSSITDDDDETDEEEEEEEDLMDRDIHARAKSLREEVRNAAKRAQELRNDHTQRAVHRSEEEMKALTSRYMEADSMEEVAVTAKFLKTWFVDDEDKANDDCGSAEGEADLTEEETTKIQSMRSSLNVLTSTLQTIDSTLPEKIEGLHHTVRAVDLALRRRRNFNKDKDGKGNEEKDNMGDGMTLSQIERAIISRDNEGNKDREGVLAKVLEDQEREREKIRNLGAVERFGLLMGG